MPEQDALETYHDKRRFERTPEPSGDAPAPSEAPEPRFVVQQHAARRLHWDLRLEVDGVLKSWAVPKGPPETLDDKRLAVQTEDHPLEYLTFHGVIPKGEYGAGTMDIWDTGTYRNLKVRNGREVPMVQTIEKGHLMLWLEGAKLRGGYHLVRTTGPADGGRTSDDKRSWLMMRMREDTSARLLADWLRARGAGADAARPVVATPPRAAPAPAEPTAPATPPPDWVEPMLAELGRDAFVDPDWLFERKLDGERCLAFRHGGVVRLWSRSRQPLNDQYPELVAALLEQPADDFIADGEIVAFAGRATSFSRLQRRMHMAHPSDGLIREVPVSYYLFDLLYVRGYDLRGLPLRQRKSLLRSAFLFEEPLRWTPYRVGDGRTAFADACRRGWEGVIAKRGSGSYASRRSGDWLKLKCVLEQEFVIGGYTAGQGRRTGFGALLLGYYDGDRLAYAGKVGTGFDEATLQDLRAELAGLRVEEQPFAGPPIRLKDVRWVRPVLVAQIVFDGWTEDAQLWHSRFLGLRRDKDPRAVVREAAPA